MSTTNHEHERRDIGTWPGESRKANSLHNDRTTGTAGHSLSPPAGRRDMYTALEVMT
jgi:hypothetical protein